jgi:glycosyltransferase involved in cell wall biosynthesis
VPRGKQQDPDCLRVLYLSWRDQEHPEAGGSETYVERTAAVLADHGHDVTILAAAFPGGSERTRHGAVRVLRRGGRFTVYLRGLAHLVRHRSDYDVVVDVQNGVPFWSPLVTRLPVVPVVHHAHRDQWPVIMGPALGALGWFLESRVAPRVYRRCRYVTVSRATLADLTALGVDPARVTVTYSGNDLPEDYTSYRSVPRSAQPRLMVLGRMVPHKHVEVAIDLVRDLRKRYPTLEMDVVGSGYWLDRLREHASRVGVADRVTFHGFVDERTKNRLLAESWVVLMPSQKEGWGLTIVEAGLHGTPAVAFAHAGGVTESIVDAETGLLAKDRDEMLTQVATLLSDAELRDKYGENARHHACGFSWAATGDGLEAVLREVATR